MRPANEIRDAAGLLTVAQRARRLLIVPSVEMLTDTVRVLYALALLSDKVLPLKSYFNVTQDIQRGKRKRFTDELGPEGVQQETCTEDVFMVACGFLEVEIAKQGSIYYLKGESPEFKETKKHRNPIDLTDDVTLKSLASSLARPDEERGAIERGQIISGANHLGRLVNLRAIMPAAVKMLKSSDTVRKIDVRKALRLPGEERMMTHTDYERMMSMARREGLISFRNRKRDPMNHYVLRAKNHQRVIEYAQRFGYSPQKTLNRILDDFFLLVEKQDQLTDRH